MSMIKTIQNATEPETSSPILREKLSAAEPYWDALGKAFSFRWVNEFWSVNADAWTEEVNAAYERGFLNATQLLSELFQKIHSN